MTDRRRGSGQRERPSEEDNPFAPPPEGQPDRPWRPRLPSGDGERGGDQPAAGPDEGERQDDQRSRWGSQWSRRQPRRQSGPFGDPPSSPEGGRGRGRGGGMGQRWDPTDPGQRHARYAVLSGMWGVFSGLLGWEWLGLLLGALSLYWGVSALRGGPRAEAGGGRETARRERLVAQLEGDASSSAAGSEGSDGLDQQGSRPPLGPEAHGQGKRAAVATAARADRPQFAAAIAGIVLASASLLIVATAYTMQLVYKDYFDCVDDALTTPSREACEELLPSQVRPFLPERG